MRRRLSTILNRLRKLHGRPAAPEITDPFHQILLEQVGYLATDAKRRAAFERLRDRVGLEPEQILAAPLSELVGAAASGGAIAADKRGARMRESAQRVLDHHEGDLGGVLELPYEKARRALTKFPMIGKPGADKVLVVAGAWDGLALDSNGLRVLLRLGYGPEGKSYDQSYRNVIDDASPQLPRERAHEAHVLLRRHGQEICKNSSPLCNACPLADGCAFAG